MITVCSMAAGCSTEHAQQLSATASNTAKLRAAFCLKSCAARTMHLCTLLRGEEEKILPQLQRAAKSWQEPNRSSEKACARDKKALLSSSSQVCGHPHLCYHVRLLSHSDGAGAHAFADADGFVLRLERKRQ